MESFFKEMVEMEGCVLGALIRQPDRLDTWSLTGDDFSEPLHVEMFSELKRARNAGEVISANTVGARLATVPAITDECTVMQYVRRVAASGLVQDPRGAHIALREMANRRRLHAIGQELLWSAMHFDATPEKSGLVAVQQLDSVLSANRDRKTKATIGDANKHALDAIRDDTGVSRMPTGIKSVDTILGGWHRGQFAIIAGRPGMGKSMVALSMVLRSAMKGCGCLLFSLEMTQSEIAMRSMSDLSYNHDNPIPYKSAVDGSMTDRQMEIWGKTAAKYENMSLVIDDQRALTISEITSRAKAQKAEFERDGGRLDLIVVDHLGLIRPSDRYQGNKVQEVGEISDGLATIAKDLDVAVVALSQLNRGTEGRDNKRPTLADLRNSGDLEQDAHVVMFAYRESYYLERAKCDPGSQQEAERQSRLDMCRNTMELLVAKNRNGPTDTITLYCDPSCNAVRDLQR